MDIDLRVLRLMESEREIPFEELVQIIEQAILTAYLKHTAPEEHHKHGADEEPKARVVLDLIRGKDVTPFLLEFFHRESGGVTLEANVRIVVRNAELAAQVAAAAAA